MIAAISTMRLTRRVGDREALPEHRVEPGDEEDAGDDHRRGVQQRRDRCRAGHRVGQPGVQRELAALADARRRTGRSPPTAARGGCRRRTAPTPEMPWMLKPLVPRCSRDHELAPKNRIAVPTSSPTSPTRTVKNALSAARALGSSSHQCPISMNEQRPMISQPRISWTMFSAEDHHEHAGGEQRHGGEEVGVATVAAHVLEREDLHEQRDERDEEQQHHGQAVDVLADA